MRPAARVRVAAAIALVGLALPTRAQLLWDGDAAQGMKVMKLPNAEDGATITVVQDAQYGPVFRFHKVTGSNRCEAHGVAGFQAKENQTIFIGWRSKITMPSPNLTTNAVFQWKAYGADMQQNYPVVIKTLGGRLTLEHYAPGKIRSAVWSTATVLDQWNSLVLGIHVSRDGKVGYLQFWYNGQPQTLAGGGTSGIAIGMPTSAPHGTGFPGPGAERWLLRTPTGTFDAAGCIVYPR